MKILNRRNDAILSGDGSGYGSGYWLHRFRAAAAQWPQADRERLARAEEEASAIVFWRSDRDGKPSNGGSGVEPAAPGVEHTAPGPLRLCAKGTLHATMRPEKWSGERLWVVALYGEVVGDAEKMGARRRVILGEVA